MTTFNCHTCGFKSTKKGLCPNCGKPLHATCPVCGYGKDYCICTADIASTKAHKPR
ncbi:MAG: hypothetical protein QXU88_02765 [Candidatus Woesearchaeota archaeon]